jgi:hypothetical protein
MGTLARTAVAVATVGVSALALAAPAWAGEYLITEKYIGIENCNVIGLGQICPTREHMKTGWENRIQYTNPRNVESIKVEFTANQNHCSDMIAHVYFDGKEWGSNIVHPGGSDGGYEIPSDYGLHQVAIQAEGVEGGCNTGSVSAWGGVMRVYALTPD